MGTTPVIFEAPFEAETTTKLIYTLHETPGPIDLYLSSEGGYVAYGEILIDYINNHPEKQITLVAFYDLSSEAFDVFMKSRCLKRFIGRVHATIHRTIVTQDESGQISKTDLEDAKVFDKEMYDFLLENDLLSKSKLTAFKRKRDVLIGHEKVIEIINKYHEIQKRNNIGPADRE